MYRYFISEVTCLVYKEKLSQNTTRAFRTNSPNSYPNIAFFNQYISLVKTSMCDIGMLKTTHNGSRIFLPFSLALAHTQQKDQQNVKYLTLECGYVAALHSSFPTNRISIPYQLHYSITCMYTYKGNIRLWIGLRLSNIKKIIR